MGLLWAHIRVLGGRKLSEAKAMFHHAYFWWVGTLVMNKEVAGGRDVSGGQLGLWWKRIFWWRVGFLRCQQPDSETRAKGL